MGDATKWQIGLWVGGQLKEDAPEQYDYAVVALAMRHGYTLPIDNSEQWWGTIRWHGREVADDWNGVKAERLNLLAQAAVVYLKKYAPKGWVFTETDGLRMVAQCQMDYFAPSEGDNCPHMLKGMYVCIVTGRC